MIQEEREAEMKDLVVSERVQKISPKDLKETIKEEAEKEKLATDPKESPETTKVVKEFPKVIKEKIVTSQEILIAN